MTLQPQLQRATPPPGHVDLVVSRPTETAALLTVEQVAERLGTPVRFVRRLVAERRIAFCHVGRYIRIAPADLDAFIASGHVEPCTRTDQWS